MASALILLAALLHASWNAILRGGRDRFWSITVINLGLSVPGAVLTAFVKAPAVASWGCIAASGVFHLLYNLSLVRLYRLGDLAETYPVARGSAPILVATGAATLAHEAPPGLAVAGTLLVSGGILVLAGNGRRIAGPRLRAALATGVCIAAYTIIDGVGVRVSGSEIGYIAWMFLCEAAILPLFLARRGVKGLKVPARAYVMPFLGGIISFIAYGIVILVMVSAPMGPVAALRETSVVFAAFIGRLFLHERLTAGRLAGCCVIALGAGCIGVAR